MFFSQMCCQSRFFSSFILSKVGISRDCACLEMRSSSRWSLAQGLFPYQLETRDENEERTTKIGFVSLPLRTIPRVPVWIIGRS
jgi:hypothetical protein